MAQKESRSGGVADYFAILGVGDQLQWKHTQKQHIPAQESEEEKKGEESFASTEDDAAEEERFLREIVQVSIQIVPAESSCGSSRADDRSQTTESVKADLAPAASFKSDTSSQQQSNSSFHNIEHLPHSPSHSETTATAQPPSIGPTKSQSVMHQRDGWCVIQKTLPTATAGYGSSHQDDGSPSPSGPVLWDKFQVWDANLDYATGLRGDVVARQIHAEAQQAVVNGRSQPMAGLKRNLQHTLKNFQQHLTGKHESGHVRTHQHRFYLAFQRRQTLHNDQPAIADLSFYYVRLHRLTIPLNQLKRAAASVASSSSGPALAGLAGQLFERYQSQAKHPVTDEDETLVALEDYLSLPDSFEEWSIPDEYRWIRDPATQSTPPRHHDGSRTVVLAPDDDHTHTSSGVGVEAVEAGSETESINPEFLLPKLTNISDGVGAEDEHFCFVPVIAIRRQQLDDEERYHEDPAAVEIAVSFLDGSGEAVLPDKRLDDEEEEEADEGSFRLLGKTEWSRCSEPANAAARKRIRNRFGMPVLLLRRNLPFGFADAAFATRVLGRFPFQNYKNFPLPEQELPMFCYPTGCRLHRTRFSDAPLPQYYGFVVKNERGDSIYVSCVSFMEPLTSMKVDQLARMSEKRRRTSLPHRRFCERLELRKRKSKVAELCECDSGGSTMSTEADSNFLLTGFDDMTTFENKTICLVSRYPFWTAFRKFLSHLHIIAGSLSELPIERHISHLLLTVPLPRSGGPNILVPLPALNDPMVLSMPPEKDFPLVDLPYQRLFACLEIKTIVTIVLGLLASERKVIVMSTRPALVLDVCELLRSLLFPFDLCAPYVPRLTEPFKSSLDFPGAIFVGIHDDGSPGGLAAIVKKMLPEESIVVDLDTGDVQCDGDRYEMMKSTWEVIPESARSVLVSELETLCRDAKIVDGQEPLDSQFDSAFDVALPAAIDGFDISINESREPFDDRAVRDAFLRFFCSVLGGYERYLVVPDADFLISGNEWFDAQGFLASVPSEKAPYLSSLVSTQLFQSFIQRRTEASDVHCLLFDECLSEFHSSPVPYGRLGGDVEAVPSANTDQPQMLYSLLVDQSAALPPTHDHSTIQPNRSMDTSEADSSFSLNVSKASTAITDMSVRYSESALNPTGDLVTAPSRQYLPVGEKFVYCVDGNSCFPHALKPELFLPQEPDSWQVEVSKAANSLLARSERELEEADRRMRLATSRRGLQNQRRCLWQLPKLMGSHFLGSWLLCIPALVSQSQISHDRQSRYLLRALGALRLLRSKQRIVPDEAAYRALMVACARTKSDRRVELVKLFGLLRSDGIFPSAVTLGQYTKALAEGYSKRSSVPQEEDIGGVEVADYGNRSGRCSVPNVAQQKSADLETSLNAFDSSLGTLEMHGRGWRQRRSLEHTGQSGQGEDSETAKKRTSSRSWFPVVYSSSFLPTTSVSSSEETQDIRLVAIWSRTRGCRCCSYIPLEEEIQAGWDIVGGDNEIPGAVACPRCGSLIVPMLGYRELSLGEALALEDGCTSPRGFSNSIADFGQLPPQLSPTVEVMADEKVQYVTYVSPATLRLSLEQYVEEYGEQVLQRDQLREVDPELFYNFWWYCARFSLPLPLPTASGGTHLAAFCSWDRSVAERGCWSAAKVLSPLLNFAPVYPNNQEVALGADGSLIDSLDDVPLLSRFNLQGFYSSVWDHDDLSKLLVALVEACDKRDFRPVIESILLSNQRRREEFGSVVVPLLDSCSDVEGVARGSSDAGGISPSVELDLYKTVLYLAKYQCTTAFHTFFPSTVKPCKGYHFWCANGTPFPIFDRLLQDGVQRVNSNSRDNPTVVPIPKISDVALGFRCVFGHLI